MHIFDGGAVLTVIAVLNDDRVLTGARGRAIDGLGIRPVGQPPPRATGQEVAARAEEAL